MFATDKALTVQVPLRAVRSAAKRDPQAQVPS